MPLIENGIYVYNVEDYSYEKESIYHMRYYVSSALICLQMIIEINKEIMSFYTNEPQYYRFHLDHLFYYIGLINERLKSKHTHGYDERLINLKNYIISLNQRNYNYNPDIFNIIDNKCPRNIIEHLDERDLSTIKEHNAVGGFNTLDANSDKEMRDNIINNRKYYPYILDIQHKKVLFYDYQMKSQNENDKMFEIDLLDLMKELEKLKRNVDEFEKLCNRL